MLKWLKHRFNKITFSEKRLLEKAQKGDKDAFGKLYLVYVDAIYRYIFFKVNCDRQTAEDLTEGVFYKALQHVDTFKNDGNFRAWLYKIAHNAVIDYYRTYKTHVNLEDQENILGDDDVLQQLLDKEEAKSVMNALNTLTPEQKTVITLRFVEELSHEEVARIMEKSEDAVRAIQYRGLKTLREELNV